MPLFFFLQTLCGVRTVLVWRADYPHEYEAEFPPFCFTDFKDFSPSSLGQNQSSGESEPQGLVLTWFCCVVVLSCLSSPVYTRASSCWAGTVVSLQVDQAPMPHTWVSQDLAFPSYPQRFRTHINTSSAPASGAQLQKTCTFLRTKMTQVGGGENLGGALPSRSPRPGRPSDRWKSNRNDELFSLCLFLRRLG